jgi:hypothetical protein
LEDQLKSGPEMTRIEHLSDLHYPDADPPCHFCSNQSSLSIHDSNRLKIVSGGIFFASPLIFVLLLLLLLLFESVEKKIPSDIFHVRLFLFHHKLLSLSGRVRGRDGSRESINPPYINLPSPNVQDDVNISIGCLQF